MVGGGGVWPFALRALCVGKPLAGMRVEESVVVGCRFFRRGWDRRTLAAVADNAARWCAREGARQSAPLREAYVGLTP